ncbi:hypothetical protein HA72_0946 [Metallosphaera sedula]|uniref:Uncharacterized protein n=3 Tax=Metallosphaera TaxID=41980 RepID=A4YFB6_METS5|nr:MULTISPECIES: hypothetical protein [Metallosphaera]ABP95118.1 hypothetical protein Msed_0946 [Metallosphaera sedula DSM 5348]AIM27104.1 hypothetical protein HA72_0946 [Metallosphaera sedula]AKV74012.1 hypothetical protein MsedA_0961 [Metallosphaera sedula]AKV76251.1 hypothetical protein MsedB_0962 [Metallosphaera sedula]AKV78504.1 hypothetical protein MsedC_0961 [Metallosphaera sedula]
MLPIVLAIGASLSSDSLYWWGLNVIFPLGLLIFVFGAIYRISRYFWGRRVPAPTMAGFGTQFKEGVSAIPTPFGAAAKRDPFIIVETIFWHIFMLGVVVIVGIHILAWNYIFGQIFGVSNPLWFLLKISTPEQFTSAYQLGLLGSNSYSHGGILNPLGAWNSAEVSTSTFDPWSFLAVLVNGTVMGLLAMAGILGYLVTRIVDDVTGHKRLSSSGDYVFLILLAAIVITGLAAMYDFQVPYLGVPNQANWYGLHIALVGAFIGYVPFSKGWHMFGYYIGKGMRGYGYGRKRK